jgi:hypothetical protein
MILYREYTGVRDNGFTARGLLAWPSCWCAAGVAERGSMTVGPMSSATSWQRER